MDYKTCLICGARAKGNAGLALHRRQKHPNYKGKNRIAVEETIAVLEREGKLEQVQAAQLQALRSLADQVDFDPSNAQMWKNYNEAVACLVETDASDSEEEQDEIEAIRSRTNVEYIKAVR